MEECYGSGEECYINDETWKRGGGLFLQNWVLLSKGNIESDKLWKGDSVFSEFWARGQRRRPLDLGLFPKLAGRNRLFL